MKHSIFTLALLLTTYFAWTQNSGKLAGKIRTETGESAIGITVALKSTNLGTATSWNGDFSLSNIPPDFYTVVISGIGYQTDSLEVQIFPKQTTTLDITMKESVDVLDEVTVSARSVAQERQEQAIQIESVEMRAVVSRVKDISEAIERLPGINVRGSGSFGDRADITINGLNGTAVRTYIDGLPLEFVYPAFSINNIPIDNISRVDVYKGVVPIDVGTDALGGGVNIITQQKPYNELKASYGYGSFNTHQANLSGSYRLAEDVTISATGTFNYSDNNYSMDAFVWEAREEQEVERFHDAYKLFFGDVALDIRNKPWADQFRLSANYSDFYKEVQNGGAITQFAFGDVNYEGTAAAYSLNYSKTFGEKLYLATTTNYNNNNIIFTDTSANIYSWSGEVIQRNERQRGELGENSLTDRDFSNIVNRINLSYRLSPKDELLLSNLLAHQTTVGRDETKSIERDFLTNNQYLTKNILGLQYQRKLLADKLTLAVAGKLYYFNITGIEARSSTEVTATGEQLGYYATAKYDFTERFFVRGSYESALRIPTFNQYFGNGANILSNVELQPESSDNFNLGFSYRNATDRAFSYGITANGFLRGQNDIIYLTTEQFQQFRNAEEVRTIGVEGDLFIEWRQLRLQYNITRLKQTYESIDSNNPSAQFLVGTPFPNNPTFFTNARLSYQLTDLVGEDDALRLYTQYKYVDEFNFINVGKVYDPANFVPVQHRVDVGLVYSLWNEKISLALNANNILDADIFDNFSIPRPGRNFNFKLIYTINEF